MYLPLLAELSERRQEPRLSDEFRHALLFSVPSLLDTEVHAYLHHELSSAEAPPPEWLPLFHDLMALRAALDDGHSPWWFGFGPMEMAIRICEEGGHTWEEAAVRLSQEDFRLRFSPEYAARLGTRYLQRARMGEWKEVMEPMRLLVSITADWGGGDGWLPAGEAWRNARVAVRLHWIDLIKETLCHVSDGRLLRDGLEHVRLLRQEAEASGDARMKEAVGYAAGTLLLDPYSAGLTTGNAVVALRRREDRFILQNQQTLSELPEEEWRMPSMEEALATAATHLESALVEPGGLLRGAVLKALAQVAVWQRAHGLESTHDLEQLCHEALRNLDEQEDADLRSAVLLYLRSADGSTVKSDDDDAARAPETGDFSERVAEDGPDPAFHRVLRAITVLLPARADEAWTYGRSVWPEIDRHCAENERQMFADTMRRCAREMAHLRGLTPFNGRSVEPGDCFRDYLEDFERRDRDFAWNDRERLLAIVSLVGPATELDGEGGLLELLTTVAISGELFEEFKPLIHYIQGVLHQGEGANSWKRDDPAQAAVHYCRAISVFLKDGRPTQAFDCLDYLRDVAQAGLTDLPTALNLSVHLSAQAVPLANALGAVVTEHLQWIFKRVVGGLIASGNLEAMLIVSQAAKGAAFARACINPGTRRPMDAEEVSELNRIESLRAQFLDSLPGWGTGSAAGVDDEMLLVSYIEPQGRPVDSSLAGRLEFASRRFDQREFARASSGGSDESDFYDSAELRKQIGPQTVLLNFFLATTADGTEGWMVMGFTAEEAFGGWIGTDWPSSTFHVSDKRSTASLNMAGLSVYTLRQAIQNGGVTPLPGEPAMEIDDLLEDLSRQFMGSVNGNLAALRKQGKTHLCMAPQGALHYLPFHLLSPGGKPLADDWTVSYLPALQFLKRHQVITERVELASVFGLDFDDYNPHRQSAIPDVVTEVRKIAAAVGAGAVLNEQATEKQVIEALATCRFVHLATHGEQDVRAPAFHNILLAPDANSDGRLEAHELARLDLRGLELVTLSACETSLGRFDLADNPRGIPASLFQAGAEALVGTLWPVASSTARHFHIRLYQCLADGMGKLDAFRMAQQDTRKAYPEYRHWGAFVFCGR